MVNHAVIFVGRDVLTRCRPRETLRTYIRSKYNMICSVLTVSLYHAGMPVSCWQLEGSILPKASEHSESQTTYGVAGMEIVPLDVHGHDHNARLSPPSRRDFAPTKLENVLSLVNSMGMGNPQGSWVRVPVGMGAGW